MFARIPLLAAAAAVVFAGAALAQRTDPVPKDLEEIAIAEHLDAQIPLDTPFVDTEGKPVTLGQFFDGETPVILTMNYSSCPMLCSLQLNGLFSALQAVGWNLGEEYRVLTVSIDPEEAADRAQGTEEKYLKLYDRPEVTSGFDVVRGEEADIRKVARTVGFGYQYVPETGEYAHAAVLMVCTPDGRVSRYLYGVDFDPQTVRLSLLDAADGKIGSTFDQILMFCYHYDATKGKYAPHAVRIMQLGGLVTVVVLGGALGLFWRRDARRASEPPPEEASDSAAASEGEA